MFPNPRSFSMWYTIIPGYHTAYDKSHAVYSYSETSMIRVVVVYYLVEKFALNTWVPFLSRFTYIKYRAEVSSTLSWIIKCFINKIARIWPLLKVILAECTDHMLLHCWSASSQHLYLSYECLSMFLCWFVMKLQTNIMVLSLSFVQGHFGIMHS